MQPMQKSFVAMMMMTTMITTMSATKPMINLFRVAKQGTANSASSRNKDHTVGTKQKQNDVYEMNSRS